MLDYLASKAVDLLPDDRLPLWAYVIEHPSRIDYRRVCSGCWYYPNLCDHYAEPLIMLRVILTP